MIARDTNLRETLLARQSGLCFWCAKTIFNSHTLGPKATIDHLQPVAAGGATNDTNCVAACKPCNAIRGKYNTSLWMKQEADLWKRVTNERAAKNNYKDRLHTESLRAGSLEERLSAERDRADMLASALDMAANDRRGLLTRILCQIGKLIGAL